MLDGTLRVTATQPATGISKELTIDNALSHFQADERERAEARLGALFDASDELISDGDLLSSDEADSERPETAAADPAGSAAAFPEAASLLKKARSLKTRVEPEDARDIEMLCENLEQAMAAGDRSAVVSLSVELDDILFYVQ